MTLPVCNSGQPPFKLVYAGSYDMTTGLTPFLACDQWRINNAGWSFVSLEGSTCVITHPTYGNDSGQIVQVCDPDYVPPDPDPTPGDATAVQIQAVNGYVTLTYVVGTQTVIVEPPPLTDEKLADMAEAGLLLMLALLVIYCSRALLDLLRMDTIKD